MPNPVMSKGALASPDEYLAHGDKTGFSIKHIAAIQQAKDLHSTLDRMISSDPGRAFAFTSIRQWQAKTLFCVVLAGHLALMGHRVLVIDADLYQPSLHHHFARDARLGLSQLVLGDGSLGALRDLLQTTAQTNLFFLSSGRIDLHPAALLNSPRLAVMMELCRRAYDVILINCTPLDQAGGTYPISRLVDRTVLLTNEDMLTQRVTRLALRQIALSGGAPLAVLIDEGRQSLPLAEAGKALHFGAPMRQMRRQARQVYDWLVQTHWQPDAKGRETAD